MRRGGVSSASAMVNVVAEAEGKECPHGTGPPADQWATIAGQATVGAPPGARSPRNPPGPRSPPAPPGPAGVEVSLQKALAEASETCTQECLVLGHSDNCWMPPSLTQYQQPNPPLPSIGFQQSWGKSGRSEGRHTLGRASNKDDIDKNQGSSRQQLYSSSERHCSNEDPVKVIPLANFTPNQQGSVSGGSSPYVHEHQL